MLGRRVITTRCAPDRGFALAERSIVLLEDGSTRFVKIADDAQSRRDVRDEATVLAQMDDPAFPRFVGFDDDPYRPLLIVEDLTGAYWPPPWRPGDVDVVERALDRVHAMSAPPGLAPAASRALDGWASVLEEPQVLSSTGMVTDGWIERNAESLAFAAAAAPLDGTSLVHLDVGGGNVCFVGKRAVFVDWARAALGNADLDRAFWLPALHAEGGPQPDREFDGDPRFAALVAGYYAARAGRPPHRWGAGTIRVMQRRRLACALPWACRALDLEPPDAVGA